MLIFKTMDGFPCEWGDLYATDNNGNKIVVTIYNINEYLKDGFELNDHKGNVSWSCEYFDNLHSYDIVIRGHKEISLDLAEKCLTIVLQKECVIKEL